MENSAAEPAAITRAKIFIAQNQDNALCLATVAKAVNTSTFYFCKLFKRTTDLTFTDYLARVRVEKAKTLLRDPSRRVSEIAYEVGFQSRFREDRWPIAEQLSPIDPANRFSEESQSRDLSHQSGVNP